MKKCSKCKTLKHEKDFFKMAQQKSGLDPRCKPCSKEAKNLSIQKMKSQDKDKWLADQRRYYKNYKSKNPEKVSQKDKRVRLKSMFNMTLEEYNDILESQNGRCKICLKEPVNISLCVDHCHKTGKVRGLLCSNCNTGLGLFKDSTSNLQSAILYLIENS